MSSRRDPLGPGGQFPGEDELINNDLFPNSAWQQLYANHTPSRQFGVAPMHQPGYGAVPRTLTYIPPMPGHNPTHTAPTTPQHGLQYSRNDGFSQNNPHIRQLAPNNIINMNNMNNFGGLPLPPSLFRNGPAFDPITTGYAREQFNVTQPQLPNHSSVLPASTASSPGRPVRTIHSVSQNLQDPNGYSATPLFTQTSNYVTREVDGFSDDNYGTETSASPEDNEAYGSLYDSMVEDSSDQVDGTMIEGAAARSDDVMSNATSAQVDQTEVTQDADANSTSTQSAPTWNTDIKTIDDAKKQLSGEGLVKLMITVDGDDFKDVQVEDKASQRYSKQIFDALWARPHSSPAGLTGEESNLWWSKQDKALEKCMGKIQSKADTANACSRCVVVIEKAVILHERGLSVLYLNKTSAGRVDKDGRVAKATRRELKTTSKYTMDKDIKCTTRIEQIVKAVRNSKQVALDVLNGEELHIADLVRAPTAYAAQKRLHFGSNKMRTEMLNDGKAFREEKKAKAEADHKAKAAEAEVKAATAASGADEGDDGEPAMGADTDDDDVDE